MGSLAEGIAERARMEEMVKSPVCRDTLASNLRPVPVAVANEKYQICPDTP